MTDERARDAIAGRPIALALLMLVGLFNMMDRQVVNILAEPIRRDLNLTDTQLGLLTGLSFALFYTALAVPIARLAERRDRSLIVALSLAVWSGFTALCAFVQGFGQLFAARVFVGIGEAGSGPATLALVTDITPAERRASALAFVSMGAPLGILAGLALGGIVADAWGWRSAFFVAGAPGLVLAGLVAWLVRDPRGLAAQSSSAKVSSFSTTLGRLGRKASFWWFTAGSALLSLCSLGYGAFAASYFLRGHHPGLAELAAIAAGPHRAPMGVMALLGVLLGIAHGLSGALGVLIGGRLADAAMRRDRRGYMTVPMLAALAAGPLFVAAIMADEAAAALLLLAAPMMLASVATPPVLASVQSIARPDSRATASAILLLVVNMVALGLGPLSVGLLSDRFARTLGDVEGLRWALATIALACPLAAGCYAMARRRLPYDLEGWP